MITIFFLGVVLLAAVIGLKRRMPNSAFMALELTMAIYFSLWLLPLAGLIDIFSPRYSAWNYPACFIVGFLVLLIILKSAEKVLRDKFYKIDTAMSFEDLPILNIILSLFSGAVSGYVVSCAILLVVAMTPASREFIPEYNKDAVVMAEKCAMKISNAVEIFGGENKQLSRERHEFLLKVLDPGRKPSEKKSASKKNVMLRFDEEVSVLSGFALDEIFLAFFAEVPAIYLYFSKSASLIVRISEILPKYFSKVLDLLKKGEPAPEDYPEQVIAKALSVEDEEKSEKSSFVKIVSQPHDVMRSKPHEVAIAARGVRRKLDIIYLQHRRVIRQQLSYEDLLTTEIRIF